MTLGFGLCIEIWVLAGAFVLGFCYGLLCRVLGVLVYWRFGGDVSYNKPGASGQNPA